MPKFHPALRLSSFYRVMKNALEPTGLGLQTQRHQQVRGFQEPHLSRGHRRNLDLEGGSRNRIQPSSQKGAVVEVLEMPINTCQQLANNPAQLLPKFAAFRRPLIPASEYVPLILGARVRPSVCGRVGVRGASQYARFRRNT